jgi:hypothetical protein
MSLHMLRARWLTWTVFAALLLAACSSGSGVPQFGACDAGGLPVINSFTATPSTLPLEGGFVTLAWNVTGASGLSIDQSLGAVAPVTSGRTSVDVTSFTTFKLSATNFNGTTTLTVEVTVSGPVTVNGVVSSGDGLGVAGATVLISSGTFTQTTISDSSGAFHVANVPTPYDATLIEITPDPYGIAPSEASVIKYVGLTRSDPQLTEDIPQALAQGIPKSTNRSATLNGKFVGGSYPETPGYFTEFVFISPQTGQELPDSPSGSYSVVVNWPGPTTTTGTLYALQIHADAGLPLDYAGYGTLSGVELEDGASLSSQDVRLGPVDACLLVGTIDVPTSETLESVSLQESPGLGLRLLDDSSGGTSFSYVVPALPGSSLVLGAAAFGTLTSSFAGKQVPTNSPVTLSVPAAPTLILPAASATNVTVRTPFVWSQFPGGVHGVAFSAAYQTLILYTAATTTTLPDFADAGVPLRENYLWMVTGIAPVASIDALAAPGGVEYSSFDQTMGVSVEQFFNTGP